MSVNSRSCYDGPWADPGAPTPLLQGTCQPLTAGTSTPTPGGLPVVNGAEATAHSAFLPAEWAVSSPPFPAGPSASATCGSPS